MQRDNVNCRHLDRRQFLRSAARAGTAAAGFVAVTSPNPIFAAPRSANEKLNIGCIGVAAQGAFNLSFIQTENIVALCDIDSRRLAKAAAQFPRAKTYVDFRQLLEQKDLDAVVVSTPDHMHAIPVVEALKRELDVYCEKPLAHTVYEARQMRRWAAKQKAVTQMGTQIHANDNYRRVVEFVQSGRFGAIERVHVWIVGEMRLGKRVSQATPPDYVNYDLWLGTAPARPYDTSHFHYNWRFWFDFGGGELEDFGCHYIDLPFWALELGDPEKVTAQGERSYRADNDVPDNMRVDYRFPARGQQPAVHLTWYHGAWKPDWTKEYGKNSGVLFEGSKGRLLADYHTLKAFTDAGTIDPPPQSIPRSIGHHQEWIHACKSRGTTTCNFDYSGRLTEAVLLGNVAYRAGQKELTWDPDALKAPGCPEADAFIRTEYRPGWTLTPA